MQTSVVFKWNAETLMPVVVNQGGTSSGKTYSILQVLFMKAAKEPGIVITVAGQDIPNLKVGALRDAENIYKNTPAIEQRISSYNRSDRTFHFYNRSIIEFKSYDNAQDAKSGKRDYLFVNEANGIPYAIYIELALRTRKQIFVDYNPNEVFYIHEKVIGQPGTQLFISDHRHNPFLHPKVREKIEALKEQDEELWKVYARGLTGKIEGLIFRNYHIVDEIPQDAKLVGYGLDFGFTNDPTAFLKVYKQDGELWIDELIYQTGLTNPAIAEQLKMFGVKRQEEIIADSSEPKSIQEISNYNFHINGANKGPDSVRSSIDILKRYKLNITRKSTGLKKEIASYKWQTSKNGDLLSQPTDFLNHSIDALRYVALNKLSNTASGHYALM